jgi:hypothetical protein
MKRRKGSMKRIAITGAAVVAAVAIAVPTAGAKPLPSGPADATPTTATTATASSEGPSWAGIGVAAGFALGLVGVVRSGRRHAQKEERSTASQPRSTSA